MSYDFSSPSTTSTSSFLDPNSGRGSMGISSGGGDGANDFVSAVCWKKVGILCDG